MKAGISRLALLALLAGGLSGCFAMLPTQGGAYTEFSGERRFNTADVLLEPGYEIELVTSGLTFPTGIAFDASGRPYVLEAGYSYGEVFTTPRLLRLEPGGATTVVASGEGGPWTGVVFDDGAFYVASFGAILRVDLNGSISTVLEGLPSEGDHHTNGPAIGPDGWLYFGQGTATNSGVVGPDNYEFGWLKRAPRHHDIPCEEIVLAGENFTSDNPFRGAPDSPLPGDPEQVTTGAYVPFGTVTTPGQVVGGQVPCTGAIMRVRPSGGPPELVAWGFRNPFGLAFSSDGRLYVTDNGFDERGSRPVFGTGDLMYVIEPGRWYGWPDFYAGHLLDEENRGKSHPGPPMRPLLARHPSQPPEPVAAFGVHASADGFDFSRNPAFGNVGQAFVAQLGDMVPGVGKTLAPVGFKVVKVDVATGVVHDFAVNRGELQGPASWGNHGGLERPVAVRFDPAGTALYVVDFGVLTSDERGNYPRPGTGAVWRITRTGTAR
ncbi:PQQ-dependent sugar dehydrogenase [Allosphingosinicella sp.]|uniref:PQQ-dependent sugar dehydrogenase n=1 Tax=Allosphingosinicella sp. TaxID=2823234 RepID=UPI002FC12D33